MVEILLEVHRQFPRYIYGPSNPPHPMTFHWLECRPPMHPLGRPLDHLNRLSFMAGAWAPQRRYRPPECSSGKALDAIAHLDRRLFVEVSWATRENVDHLCLLLEIRWTWWAIGTVYSLWKLPVCFEEDFDYLYILLCVRWTWWTVGPL